MANVFVNISGAPSDVVKGGSSLAIDMASATGSRFTGSTGAETFLHLGNQGVSLGAGGAIVTGGGGHDTFKFGDNQISWYGTKHLSISDFTIGGLATNANADILDLSSLSGSDFNFIRTAEASGSALTIVRKSDTTCATVVHLTSVDPVAFENVWNAHNGQVILA